MSRKKKDTKKRSGMKKVGRRSKILNLGFSYKGLMKETGKRKRKNSENKR